MVFITGWTEGCCKCYGLGTTLYDDPPGEPSNPLIPYPGRQKSSEKNFRQALADQLLFKGLEGIEKKSTIQFLLFKNKGCHEIPLKR